MTDKETLKLALDALNSMKETLAEHEEPTTFNEDEAITAIKEALAQPEQEPVAWGVFEGNLHDMFFTQEEAQEMARLKGSHAEVKPLYTVPPQRTEQEPVIDKSAAKRIATVLGWTPPRTWVGLTDEEQQQAYEQWQNDGWGVFYKAIEAKLKEKNT